jgi:hypothetical protein
MTANIAKKAGLKLFEKHLQRYEPADPLYEIYTDDSGRQKRRKVRPYYRRTGWFHLHHQIDRKSYLVSSAKFLLVYQSGTPAFSNPSRSALITSTWASTSVASGSDGPSSSVCRAISTPDDRLVQLSLQFCFKV